jgi:RNA polymerase sigma factor (sigma-70 family)
MSEPESPQEPRQPPWQCWAQSLRDSDLIGFRDMVDTLAPVVRNWFLWKGVKDFRDAEELTEDVFVWLWQHRQTYDQDRAKLWTWIKTCACKIVLQTHWRKQARKAPEPTDPQALAEQVLDDPDDDEPVCERICAFLAALDVLPDIQLQIVRKLLEVPGLTNSEIAHQLSLTNEQVKVYKFRAFKAVREFMEGQTDVQTSGGGQADASA